MDLKYYIKFVSQNKTIMTAEKLTHWKKLENPNYLGAYSLEANQDLTVMIERVVREQVIGLNNKKEECSVAYLKGQKPMVLNATNQKMITKVVGTPYIEQWAGKEITLYVAHIKAFGEDNVECLRIRQTVIAVTLPELKTTDSVNWNKIVTAMKQGYTIEQIRIKWNVSDINAQLLIQESTKVI